MHICIYIYIYIYKYIYIYNVNVIRLEHLYKHIIILVF